MIDIAFLILNYKTYRDTINITNEILNGFHGDLLIKILIVDNASDNNSYDILQDVFNGNDLVEVVSSGENGGFARGNNFGLNYLKKYSPEYVCLLNNDVHFQYDTIVRLRDVYPTIGDAAIIAPVQFLPDNTEAQFPSLLNIPSLFDELRSYFFILRLATHKYKENTSFANLQRVSVIPGAFMFCNFNIFEEIGFFDEFTFLFGEEKLLAKKIALCGLHNYIILNEKYIHEHSKTINSEASLLRQKMMILEGKLIYARHYRRFPTLCILLIKLGYYYCRIIECTFYGIYKKIKESICF